MDTGTSDLVNILRGSVWYTRSLWIKLIKK